MSIGHAPSLQECMFDFWKGRDDVGKYEIISVSIAMSALGIRTKI